jgi:hypothetical protein
MTLTFEIAVLDFDRVQVRWPKVFGRPEVLDAVRACLLTVRGADAVTLGQYTATLQVASHVTSLGEFVDGVQRALLDDGWVAAELQEAGVAQYAVALLPSGVVRAG